MRKKADTLSDCLLSSHRNFRDDVVEQNARCPNQGSSSPRALVELIFDGVIVPVLNEEIMAEYRNVLARPKFHLTEEIVEDVIADMTERGVFVDAETLEWDLPDAKDRVFYEVVMEERKSEDAYLVTGNLRHFPVKPFVVTPREMLDIIIEDAQEWDN